MPLQELLAPQNVMPVWMEAACRVVTVERRFSPTKSCNFVTGVCCVCKMVPADIFENLIHRRAPKLVKCRGFRRLPAFCVTGLGLQSKNFNFLNKFTISQTFYMRVYLFWYGGWKFIFAVCTTRLNGLIASVWEEHTTTNLALSKINLPTQKLHLTNIYCGFENLYTEYVHFCFLRFLVPVAWGLDLKRKILNK